MGVIEIRTAEEFWALVEEVEDGVDTLGLHYKILNDIDLGCSEIKPWHPLGSHSYYGCPPFRGHLDGGGHTVSGMLINGTNAYHGLIGWLGKEGSVKDITVSGTIISNNDNIGGVVGFNEGDVTNCTSIVDIIARGAVGGVVGMNNGRVISCCNKGNISGSYDGCGGVVGSSHGQVEDCHNSGKIVNSARWVGGVVGDSVNSVERCTNRGIVIGNRHVGGVVGTSGKVGDSSVNVGEVYSLVDSNLVSGASDIAMAKKRHARGETGKFVYELASWQYVEDRHGYSASSEAWWTTFIFKYHPNFLYNANIGNDVDRKQCDCCGAWVTKYCNNMYGPVEVDCICLECVATGRAADEFNGTFIKYVETDKVPNQNRTDELLKRTPGYFSPNGEEWKACCDDYCAFFGEVSTEVLEEMNIADDIFAKIDIDTYGTDVREDMKEGGILTGYLFQCLHCGEYYLEVDC